MKVLFQTSGERDCQLIVNLVESERQGRETFSTLWKAANHFLNIRPIYIGSLREDPCLTQSVRKQQPVMLLHPECLASHTFRELAGRLLQETPGMCAMWEGRGKMGVPCESPTNALMNEERRAG